MFKYTPATGENKIYALNKGNLKHIGTIRGQAYVKGVTYNSLLHYPVLSAAIGIDEMQEIKEKGAKFIKLERGDIGTTHVIEIEKFIKHSVKQDRGWGMEYECPLHHFETTNKIKHNAVLNNPPLEVGTVFERPQAQQLPMFAMARFDQNGNYRG